ncbi:MAG: response regulator [Candidatus Lustribacter sp.]
MSRVLVAEDSPTQAELLRAILEQAGLEVVLAPDAERALSLLEQAPADLVISDIVMPGMSGYELCRRIKALPGHSSIPVVLLSTLREPMDIIRGLECGADSFLTKPYQPDQIVGRINTILQNRDLRGKVSFGIDIAFLGQRFNITSDKEQILDMLISTFEDTVRANRDLQQREAELAEAKRKVEEYAQVLEGRVHISEEKFRGFLTASPDAMLVVDERGTIILASQRVEAVLGYLPEELVGRQFDLLMPERFHTAHASHVRDYLRAPRPRDMGVGLELYALRKDGGEFPIEISLSPHQTPDGLVVIAAIRDIAKRKQAEAALQQAQKMEAVGQLTSGIAHDFNNVLGAVIGNLDLLADAISDNPQAARFAESALTAALSGAELVKRLLAFSRRQPLRAEPLDLRETIASTTPLIRRTISEQIAIVERLADDLWVAVADPSQIGNAVLNLAINARDAMPDGGTLTIDCRNVTVDEDFAVAYGADFRPGDYVVISVSDTGHGMPPEIVARAFDPFFTTKAQGVGTGLGLSMVLGTLKQSGGTARIYSEPGHGTTVRLYLPRTSDAAASANGQTAVDVPPGGHERVLVVEDNERIREVSCAMLSDLGYRIEAVESADDALARIRGGDRFDLIFSDVVMPGKHTGITLAAELRALDPRVKIVLTSGYTSPSLLQDNFDQLGIELLSKPFRKAELAALIRKVLDEESQ